MDIGIIIQARSGSTRLPNKMFLPFYDNKGVLEIIINRIIKANFGIPIILATSNNPNDDIIEELGRKLAVKIFRGDELNVLNRFIHSAEKYNISKIIRICADNPFLDINDLRFQINSFKNSNDDYWCYITDNFTPTIRTHYGFWGEGVSLKALYKIQKLTAGQTFYTEHVTNYIYNNQIHFNIHHQKIDSIISKSNDIRLTIDTETDFELAKEIYKSIINNNIDMASSKIVEHVYTNKDWTKIMKKEIKNNQK